MMTSDDSPAQGLLQPLPMERGDGICVDGYRAGIGA